MTIHNSKIDNNIYQITPKQKAAIIKSKKQVANGEVFSNAQINQEFQKWIKRC